MRVDSGVTRRGVLLGGVLGGVLGLAGCRTEAPVQAVQGVAPPAPVGGVGYVVFNAPIFPRSRDLLLGEMNRLVDAGARDIHLAINSPGGEIEAAQSIVDAMARLHDQRGVSFQAYNIGMVASAASYVFLNAQKRYANPRSAFLFHAAGLVSNGMVNAQQLRDEADKLDAYERVVKGVMRARTRLTEGEATTYVRRTVLLTPDDARRDGVIDGISAFTVPPGVRSTMIAATPPGSGGRAPVVAVPPPSGG